MAKKAYIGVDGTARRAKKAYVGVDNVARKIRKGYIGIGGVARPCWSGGEVVKYGAVTPLSIAREGFHTASIGDYLLISGGTNMFSVNETYYNRVDAYDTALTRTTAPNRSAAGWNGNGRMDAIAGKYAIFAGCTNGSTYYKNVDAYDTELTKTTATQLTSGTVNVMGVALDENIILVGGTYSSGYRKTAFAYDSDLTVHSCTAVSAAGEYQGARVRNYAVFTCEIDDTTKCTVAYDDNRTQTVLSPALYRGFGCSNGEYAVFCKKTIAYAFDEELTQIAIDALSASRYRLKTAQLEQFALFAGGYDGKNHFAVVDSYDNELIHTVHEPLSVAVCFHFGGSVGEYALIGGGTIGTGSDGKAVESFVDAYTVV